jgi:hypothetical protein
MSEGEGVKDVSDQIEDEDQLLGDSEKVSLLCFSLLNIFLRRPIAFHWSFSKFLYLPISYFIQVKSPHPKKSELILIKE